MDFIWFNLFSMFESIGMLIFMLVIFRFKIKQYYVHVVFASFLLSQLSYYMRAVFDLANYNPFAYLLLTFVIVWLLFRVQIFYASVMAIVGYLFYHLLLSAFVFIGNLLGLYTLDDIAPFTLLGYVIQTLTTTLVLILCYFLVRYRIGFTFVPYDEYSHVKINRENLIFISIIIIGAIIAAIFVHMALQNLYSFIAVFLLGLITLVFLFLMSLRMEHKDD